MTNTIQTIDDIVLSGRDCSGIEWINGERTALHIIRMPDITDKGFYRSAVSQEYFIERETRNWYENYYLKNKVCSKRVSVAYSYDSPSQIKLCRDIENLPIFEHKSIWEFYDYIGYNRKTKKFW